MKPHIRKESGHWLCVESRSDRHIMHGWFGETPMQAFCNFVFHQHMEEIKAGFCKKSLQS